MLTITAFITELQRRTGVTRHRTTIADLCAAGVIHAEKPGPRLWLIPDAELERYISETMRERKG